VTIGDKLRTARRKLGKRQRDIAAEVGCSQVAVQGWESNKWLPESDRIRAVASAYGVDPLDLLPKKKRRAA
jgi:transcriptional regulator with XRE-family HTH domain